MRVEVYYKPQFHDGRARRLVRSLESNLHISVRGIEIVDVYIVDGVRLSESDCAELFVDPVAQQLSIDAPACLSRELSAWDHLVEIAYKPGVTDPVAHTAETALREYLEESSDPADAPDQTEQPPPGVRTARQYLISAPGIPEPRAAAIADSLYNPLIQLATRAERTTWDRGSWPPVYPTRVPPSPAQIEEYDLAGMSPQQLARLSRARLLALTTEEMGTIRKEFQREAFLEERRKRGLSDRATDVELEMIAQTWSEHCKHKIFNAEILYHEEEEEGTSGERGQRIRSLFDTYIRSTTEELEAEKGYLASVFHDNSGVIRFDEENLICFKVETHNSPSALDPYGGAITGIVGVNRDILGTGKAAKPIFNTNVLCFGPSRMPAADVPKGLLHPRQVMEGVHRGIVDGGNQSGIPVVAGAFLFDESYLAKPLVFCGTGGLLPIRVGGEEAWIKHVDDGDLAVMVGGRIGKDGIHGATFSSQALDEESPTSAVQIGDPITQKKMLDFLLEARDLGLFKGITDNGAGGLSSSLGEMALLSGGVRIELDRCPLKYPGLAPWEILVSESQERMSLAVDPESLEKLIELAARRDVEATVVGRFTGTGYVEILYHRRRVGLLSCRFLHHGLPPLRLEARWSGPARPARTGPVPPPGPAATGNRDLNRDLNRDTLALLSDPNIASKEERVRQYDHEVQARSVIGPFTGSREDGPSDGAVLRLRQDTCRGITVTHGICPRYGDDDTYQMALCAVDEAYRAHIACGGDPDHVSALDNFCWPDPVASEHNPDGPFKLAQLVRACRGLREACLAYRLPLISGKDSMKNDAVVEGRKLSVRPTLLVSLMGVIEDVRRAVSTDFKAPGDEVFILGRTRGELGCTAYETLVGRPLGCCPRVRTDEAVSAYRALHAAIRQGLVSSCHDLSDGGLAVALCESALGGRLGAEISLDRIPTGVAADAPPPVEKPEDHAALLFSETPSRFLLSASSGKGERLRGLFGDLPLRRIGAVSSEPTVRVTAGSPETALIDLPLDRIQAAWKGGL